MAGTGDYTKEFTIAINTQFTDSTDQGLKRARKSFDEISDSAEKARKSIKELDRSKASPELKAKEEVTSAVEKAEKRLKSLNNEKAEASLSADSTPFESAVGRAEGQLETLSLINPNVTIGAKDNASYVVGDVVSDLDTATNKVWSFELGVIDKVTSPLISTYNWLTSIQGIVTGLFASQAWQSIVGAPVETADFYTTANIGFETMFSSAGMEDPTGAASEYMDRIKDFAVTTPFNTSGLVEMTQRMLAMGFAADEIIPKEDALSGILGKVGNAMAAMGKGEEGVDAVTLALSQMNAAGKVSANDMMQLTNAGIPAWNYLAKAMGISVAEVRELSSAGQITAQQGIQAMLDGMSQFDGMMEKTANETVSGLLSQLEDVFEMGIKQPWGEGLAQGLKPALETINNVFGDITAEGSKARTAVSEIAAAVGETLGGALQSIATLWSDVVGSAEFDAADAKGKVSIFLHDGILEPLKDWWDSSGRPFVEETVKGALDLVGQIIKDNFGSILSIAFSNPITAIKTLQMGLGGLQTVFNGFNSVKGMIDRLKDLRTGIQATGDAVGTLVGTATDVAGSIGTASKAASGFIGASENVAQTVSMTALETETLADTFMGTAKTTGSVTEGFLAVKRASEGFAEVSGNVKGATDVTGDLIEALGAAGEAGGGVAEVASQVAPAVSEIGSAAGTAEAGMSAAATAGAGLSTSLLGIGAAAAGAGAVAYTLYQQWKQTSGLITEVVEQNNQAKTQLNEATGSFNTLQSNQAEEAESLNSGSGDITGLTDRLYTLSAGFDGSQAQAGEMQLLTEIINQKAPEIGLEFNADTGELSVAREEIDSLISNTKLTDTKTMASGFYQDIIDAQPELQNALKASTDSLQALYDKRKELEDSGVYRTNKAYSQLDSEISGERDTYNAALDQQAAADLTTRAASIVSAPDFTGSWDEAMEEARSELLNEGYELGEDMVIHMSEGLKASKGYMVTSIDGTLSSAAVMPPGTETAFYEIGSHASNTYVNGWIDQDGNLRDATTGGIINAAHYQMDTGNSVWYETAVDGVTQYKQGWIDDNGQIVDATTGQIQAGIDEASLRTPQMYQIGTEGQEQYVAGFTQNGHIVSATGEILDEAVANAQAYPLSYYSVGSGSGGELVHGFVDSAGNLHDETGRIVADSTQVITDKGPDYKAAGATAGNSFLDGLKSAWESVKSWWSSANQWLTENFQVGTSEAVQSHNEAMGYASPDSGTPWTLGEIPANAEGNIISSPTLSLVGEAGPEAIIPLSGSKRDRGLSLWQEAGRQLGVREYAEGDIVGTPVSETAIAEQPVTPGVETMTAEQPASEIEETGLQTAPAMQPDISLLTEQAQALKAGIIGTAEQTVTGINEITTEFSTGLTTTAEQLKTGVTGIFEGMKEAVTAEAEKLADKVREVFKGIPDAVSESIGRIGTATSEALSKPDEKPKPETKTEQPEVPAAVAEQKSAEAETTVGQLNPGFTASIGFTTVPAVTPEAVPETPEQQPATVIEGTEVSAAPAETPESAEVTDNAELMKSQLTGITLDMQAQVETGFSGMRQTAVDETNALVTETQPLYQLLVKTNNESFSQLAPAASSGMNSVEGTVGNGMNRINQSAVTGLNTFNVSFSNGFNTVNSTAGSGMVSLIATIGSYNSQFNSSGQAVASSFEQGIRSKAQSVVDATNDLVAKVKDAFEKGLGIHSPSKVGEYYGEMMGEGVIRGFSDSDLISFVESTVGDMKTAFEGGTFSANELVDYMGDDTPALIDYLNRTGDETTGQAAPADDNMIAYPLIGTKGTQTSWFGYRPPSATGGIGTTNHGGADLAAPTGTPIASALGGTVTTAGSYGGYGNAVVVDSGGGLSIVYGHMSQVGAAVGQQVQKGQQIGLVGSTGHSTGPHLHFEIRQNGSPIDPQPYLDGASPLEGGAAPNTLAGTIQMAYNASKGIAPATAGSPNMGNIDYDISAGAEQWRPLVIQALTMLGQPTTLADAVMATLDQESSGNPNAINDWDSNWKAGIPSKGLMQVIDPTFRAYALPGYDANIWDPLSNILASLNYQLHRYGGIEAHLSGYAKGTDSATPGLHWVGEKGPELMYFNGGETVIPHDESISLIKNQVPDLNPLSLSSGYAEGTDNAPLWLQRTPDESGQIIGVSLNREKNEDLGQVFNDQSEEEADNQNSSYTVEVGGVNVSITVNNTGSENIEEKLIEAGSEVGNIIAGKIARGLAQVSEGTPVVNVFK